MRGDFIITKTSVLDEQTKQQLLDLWNTEYPEKLSYKGLTEFDDYLQKLSNTTHFLLTSEQNVVCGWAFTFDRENERWFAIILSESIQGKGLGRKMLDELKQTEPVLHGWVIDHNHDKKKNGQCYNSPLTFYEKCGFAILHQDRLELGNISAVKIKWTAEN